MKLCVRVFFFKQKTAYELRISDWSSDVCSSDLRRFAGPRAREIELPLDPLIVALGPEAQRAREPSARHVERACEPARHDIERARRMRADRKSTRLNSSH